MESTKSVTFASLSGAEYERVQTQIPYAEDAVAAATAVATANTNTKTKTESITRTSRLRRRSSIVSAEHPSTNHPAAEENYFHSSQHEDVDNNSETGNGIGLKEYASVLARNPSYRAYLASHLCQNLGDYFVRIANVLVVEELASNSSSGIGAALASVTLARLLPNALFALMGGVLADRLDKRRLMITSDCVSGLVVLGYLLAIRYESLPLLYGVTVLRSALSATYYPSAAGILPDLVGGEQIISSNNNINSNSSNNYHSPSFKHRDMQLAVTLNSWAWGGSVIVGGLLAGKVASLLGLKACYLIDCATYWTSALLIARGVKTDYKKEEAARNCNEETNEKEASQNESKSHSLVGYLMACGFGWMIFAKPSASLVWGIEDIVGAQFATVFRDDGTEDVVLSSVHMGLLFSTIGLGCSIGPILLNTITDARKPYTLQRACWIGLVLLGLGWLAISFVDTFPQFLWGSFLRTMGSGVAWVYSSLILQTLCDSSFLGRVLALEYTLTTLFEAATSFMAGNLSVSRGLSKNQLALLGAGMGLLVVIVWGIYYSLSLGAAHPRFNSRTAKNSYEVVREINRIEMGNKRVETINSNNIVQNSSDGLV